MPGKNNSNSRPTPYEQRAKNGKTPSQIAREIVDRAAGHKPPRMAGGIPPVVSPDGFTPEPYQEYGPRDRILPVAPTKFANPPPPPPLPLAESMGPMPGTPVPPPPPPPGLAPPSERTTSFISRLTGPLGSVMGRVTDFFQSRGLGGKATKGGRKKPVKKPGRSGRKNPSKRSPQGSLGRAMNDQMGRMFSRLVLAITPIAMLGNIINANTSGFQVFLTSMKLIGTLGGMVLAPVFLGLAALMYALSHEIADELIPALGEFYGVALNAAVDAVDFVVAAFHSLVDTTDDVIQGLIIAGAEFVAWVQRNTGHEDEAEKTDQFREKFVASIEAEKKERAEAKEAADRYKALSPDERAVFDEITRRIHKAAPDPKTGKPGDKINLSDLSNPNTKLPSGPDTSFKGRFIEGLKMGIEEMRLGIGPKAQQTSLVGASRAAQMAAFNQSPFERQMLIWTEQMLRELQNQTAKLGMSH